jgi:hypothetical protein
VEGVSVKCSVLLARGYKEQNKSGTVRAGRIKTARKYSRGLQAEEKRKQDFKQPTPKSEVICRVKLRRIRGATGFTLTATKLYRRGRNSSLKR